MNLSDKTKNIFTGVPLSYIGRGKMAVWIPLKSGYIPLGFSKFIYGNTGSALNGSDLSAAEGTSYICSIATPPQEAGWWKALPEKGASFFGNGYVDGMTILNYPALIDSKGVDRYVAQRVPNIPSSYHTPQFSPAANYFATYSLSSLGGEMIPSWTNMPRGQYSIPSIGHRVLVAFYDTSVNPAIIATFPYEEEWEQTVDKC